MTGTATDPRAARDKLLQKINESGDLPALGASVSQVVRIASSAKDSVRELSSFLLNDAALTQKMLRLANSSYYRRADSAPVSTVSRAIFLLGFDTIKSGALALLLVERIKGGRGKLLRNELALALAASVIGRELARRSRFRDAEEATAAALFRNLGRVLLAAHDAALYEQAAALAASGALSQTQAAEQVFGCSFDMLAEEALRKWKIPDSIVHAFAPLPSGRLKAARSRAEWMQQVAQFSAAMAAALPRITEPGRDEHSRALIERYGAALDLDAAALARLFAAVSPDARALVASADVGFAAEVGEAPAPAAAPAEAAEAEAPLQPEQPAPQAAALPEQAPQPAPAAAPDALAGLVLESGAAALSGQRHASGKPLDARDMLLAGAQGVTEMIAAGNCNLNDLMFQVLETLYSSLGFRYATVCLRDVQTGLYRSRVALGATSPKLPKKFAFATGGGKDLFHLALQNDADLFISDASSAKIVNLLPSWHRNLVPVAKSLMILPLLAKGNPVGYYYADREVIAPEGLTPEETALIKMLKRQVLAVINSR
jgi:HD-like signal output (HDOD) protein